MTLANTVYASYGDPPPTYGTITTTTNTSNGYWLDGVWYPYVQTYPDPWYQPVYPSQPLYPGIVGSPAQPLVVPQMDLEALQKLVEALQAGKFNPPPPAVIPEEKAAPEPAQEAENPIKPPGRKLNLDD